MRVVGYVRVSTDEQSRDGVSLAAQAEKVRLFAGMHGLDLVELVEDAGASGKSLGRPGLARALALLDSGQAEGLVISKLDRLTRSVVDWNALIDGHFGERAGRQLFSVADSIDTRTAVGRMILNIIMALAQCERETIVERTRGAMAFKRSRGERISGRIPFGSDLAADGRTLVDNPAELAVPAEIRAIHRDDGRGPGSIARALNARGVPTKTGGPWSPSTVRALLSRPI